MKNKLTHLIYRPSKVFILWHIKTAKSKKVRYKSLGGARGVMVTVLRNGHGDTSSNPGRD